MKCIHGWFYFYFIQALTRRKAKVVSEPLVVKQAYQLASHQAKKRRIDSISDENDDVTDDVTDDARSQVKMEFAKN
jgi:hypothetical protein